MNNFKRKPKLNFGFIYKYTSPSGKCYIGQTTRSLEERAAGSHGAAYKACPIFYSAIQKYGFENFVYEILCEVPIENLDTFEQYYIKKFNSLAPNGYNAHQGGAYNYGTKGTNKTKIKQYTLDGVFVKEYNSVKEAAEDNNTLYQAIEGVLRRIRAHHRGFIYRYYDEDAPEPVIDRKTCGRLTGQYDLEGNLLNVFESANAAARSLGKGSGRNIRSVCAGKRFTAYGYKWKYLD